MNKTILYVVSPKAYEAKLIKILRGAKGYTTIYVGTSKDTMQLQADFKRNKLDISRFFFIDCTSKQAQEKIKAPSNTICIKNPGSLTEISLTISEVIKQIQGKKLLVVESLSSLLVYNSSILVSKFSNFLINNIQAHQIRGIFIVVNSDMSAELVAQVGSACDEIKNI